MLLLPEYYPIVPFEDATGLLDQPDLLRAQAEALGYLYFAGFIPSQRMAEVRALVSGLSAGYGWTELDPGNPPFQQVRPGAEFAGYGWDDPRFVRLQTQVCTHPAFRSLVQDESILRILEIVYGEAAAVATMNQCWIKLPGDPERTTLPHQDTYYLPSCPRMWSVWFPLVDTPLEVGPLAVIPGSHRKAWYHQGSLRGIDVPKDVVWATGPVRPGDVVAYGAATVHCAWSNVSQNNVRVALDVRYEPLAMANSILRPDACMGPRPGTEV
jgi:hypothetical protein